MCAMLCKLCYYLLPRPVCFKQRNAFVLYQPLTNCWLLYVKLIWCGVCRLVVHFAVALTDWGPLRSSIYSLSPPSADTSIIFCQSRLLSIGCDRRCGANLVACMLVAGFSSICSHYCTINTTIIRRAPGIHSDSDIAWFPIHYMRVYFRGVLSSVCAVSHEKSPQSMYNTARCYGNE